MRQRERHSVLTYAVLEAPVVTLSNTRWSRRRVV